MERTVKYIFLISIIAGFCACTSTSMPDIKGSIKDFKSSIVGDKGPTFEKVDPANLKPAAMLGLVAFDAAKLGRLQAIPYVKINPEGLGLDNKTDCKTYRQRNIVISEFNEAPDGFYSQTMVVESIDKFGRIDLSHNHIAFKIRPPDLEEAASLQKSIIKAARKMKGTDKALHEKFKTGVLSYQQSRGLTPDGTMGEITAALLAQEFPILDVQKLSSKIIYPQQPRHGFYILPFEAVASDPQAFNQGFKSLAAVEKHAVSLENFKEMAKPQEKFVLFVYFFDRVDPASAIQVGFSTVEKRPTQPMGPKRYAVPETWPVLIEPFSIEKELPADRLYVNLFKSNKPIFGMIKTAKCIGTCRLK